MIIGLGTDIIEISRIQKVNKDNRLAKRILTVKKYLTTGRSKHRTPDCISGGRFAVKEAYVKHWELAVQSVLTRLTVSMMWFAKPSLKMHRMLTYPFRDYAVTT